MKIDGLRISPIILSFARRQFIPPRFNKYGINP